MNRNQSKRKIILHIKRSRHLKADKKWGVKREKEESGGEEEEREAMIEGR